jgi:hypothetical protein
VASAAPAPPAWASREACTGLRAHEPRTGADLSATPYRTPRPAETVGGLLASISIFTSLAGVAYRPLRLIPFALLLALISVAIGGRNQRLAAIALFLGAVCFAGGLAVAVITSHPLW